MLLNKCKTGDHIAVCKQCNIASIHCLYDIFFSVSLLLCFSNSCNLGPGSALGEEEKKIGERSEPSGSLGRERVAVAPPVPPPRPTHRRTSLADIYFSHFTSCFAFPPHFGAWSQANFLLKLQTLNFFRNEFAPQDWFSYLVLSCLSYKHLGQKLSVFSYQDLDHVIREAHIGPPGKNKNR